MPIENVPHYQRVLIAHPFKKDDKGNPLQIFTTAKEYDAVISQIQAEQGLLQEKETASLATHNLNLASENESLRQQLATAQAALLALQNKPTEDVPLKDLDLSANQEKAINDKVQSITNEKTETKTKGK